VLLLWVVALVSLSLASGIAGTREPKGGGPTGTESQRASEMLQHAFPRTEAGKGSAAVVFHDPAGLRTPAVQHRIDAYLTSLQTTRGIGAVGSPFASASQISRDGTTAYATVDFDAAATTSSAHPVTTMQQRAGPLRAAGIETNFAGDAFVTGSVPSSEVFGLAAAAVILLMAFGSVVAMGLPIVTALFGIGIGLAGVVLWSHVFITPGFTPQVASMVGIGVGIDYALFIVTRYRGSLAHMGPREALVEAMSTSGRAVVFAGCTVMVSMLGMLVIGLPFLYGLAVGVSSAVLVAVLAAITLLPALLGFAGRRIDAWSVHRRSSTGSRPTLSSRWSGVVQRHPVAGTVFGLALLASLAAPALALHLGVSDEGNQPAGTTTKVAYDQLADGFGPGFNGPFVVAASLPPGASRATSTAILGRLTSGLRATPGVALVEPPRISASGRVAVVQLYPTTSPQSRRTEHLLHVLRGQTVPAAIAGTGAKVLIGGDTPQNVDFTAALGERLPLFMGAVLGLSFLLLLVVFRSILVPLKAVVLNLLSIGAAYGLLVMVFQWGWFSGLFHVSPGPIEPWAPMMLFAITFGLSMDYEVFLLSRIREEYDRTRDNTAAVAHGLATTARVITAAAAIMVCVFGTFVVGDDRALILVGLGLSSAVLLDATLVRMLLVPASMELLGDRNWWFPRRLERLVPHVGIE
jgi:RND superfamily putative drug exporter